MSQKLKILIAEDVESNFLYLKAVLRKIDSEILWAKNGNEAIDLVRQQPDISIILMDLLMPDLNGFEATSIIKNEYPEIKIIAQTAFALPEDREKALMCGCDEYIAKPIRSADLIALIDQFK
ncbi:MAG: response regulator [Mangrovibacterium sp.]